MTYILLASFVLHDLLSYKTTRRLKSIIDRINVGRSFCPAMNRIQQGLRLTHEGELQIYIIWVVHARMRESNGVSYVNTFKRAFL